MVDVAMLATFAISDMHALVWTINVRHLQAEPLTDSQAEAINYNEEDPIAQLSDCINERMHFFSSGNNRKPADTRRADDLDPFHFTIQYVAVEEL
jgi:hypothetical protein